MVSVRMPLQASSILSHLTIVKHRGPVRPQEEVRTGPRTVR